MHSAAPPEQLESREARKSGIEVVVSKFYRKNFGHSMAKWRSHPCTPWYSFFFSFLQLTVRLVRELLFNFRAVAPKEGIAEEFKVGDTCKPSVARNLLRQVIPLPGTLLFSSIFVPARKIPPVKVAPFRWPPYDFFFSNCESVNIEATRKLRKSCKRGTSIKSSRISF